MVPSEWPDAHRAAGRVGLWAVLAGLAAWGAGFIWKTSFVLGGRRVFCLLDDAMISMAYARNVVAGLGLDWARQGHPVEGFTHPLWTALMVPVNALPVALDRRAVLVQALSLGILLWNVVLVGRLVRRHYCLPGACHWLPACVLTALYYPLNAWALAGMETGLQALLTTALVLLALDIVEARRDRHLALWLTATLALLLRMDMALPVAVVQLFVLARGGLGVGARAARAARAARIDGGALRGEGGRPAWWRRVSGLPRGWVVGLGCMAAACGGYEAFRWSYFHDVLPNTYYLKLGGIPLWLRLLRGRHTMVASWRAHAPLLAAAAVGLGIQPWLARRRREKSGGPGPPDGWEARLALPGFLFLSCCAYSVWVGGDVWEDQERANRFVAFAVPQLFVLLDGCANQALAALGGRARGWLARVGLAAATVLALLAADGLALQRAAADNSVDLALAVPQWEVHDHERVLRRVLRLERIADPPAMVAVVWAGIPAYFSDWRLVDELGYNDRHIARLAPAVVPDAASWRDFRPGHMKWDYRYVVETRRPDVVFQIWESTREGGHAILRLLHAHGYRRAGDLWVNPRSPWIHLDRRLVQAPAPAHG